MTSLFLTESDGNESLDSYVIQTHSKTYLLMRWNLNGKGDTMLWIYIIDREPSSSFITARKRSLGQGNIFTPVCHSVHRGGVHGCFGRGACVVALGGHAWLLRGGCAWLLPGGMHGCCSSGGHAWLLPGGMHGCCSGGSCVVAPRGGHVWLLWGGMHGSSGGMCGFIQGGMHGFIRGGMHGFIQGGMHGFIQGGGMRGFFSFFGYNEIRSMSGRYASYWNACLLSSFIIVMHDTAKFLTNIFMKIKIILNSLFPFNQKSCVHNGITMSYVAMSEKILTGGEISSTSSHVVPPFRAVSPGLATERYCQSTTGNNEQFWQHSETSHGTHILFRTAFQIDALFVT